MSCTLEHILSFVSSENQLQKIFHDGSVMMKPLLCTYRHALCTLTTSTCAQKNRSWPAKLIHGSARKPRLNAGKECTFGGRSAVLLGVLSTFPFQMNRMKCNRYSHCNVLPLWYHRDVRVIRQNVHIRGRYPCQAHIPARKSSKRNAKGREQKDEKMLAASTITHNSMVNGV